MNEVEALLKERALPEIGDRSREEIIKLLEQWEFGRAPDFPLENRSILHSTNSSALGGKAICYRLTVQFSSPFETAQFPCTVYLPNQPGNHPLFVQLSFTPEPGDGYCEEIIDHGYGVATVYYQDIVPDHADSFLNGLGRFCKRNPFESWGKVSMWAFGGSRVLDALKDLPGIDFNRVAIVGHSRLGKAALWCGALEERFSLTVSVQSGCGGAALFRGKTGEKIENLAGKGSSTWFCGNFYAQQKAEDALPFDQHFLLQLVAPRHLYIASAEEDIWADPISEFLAAAKVGLQADSLPMVGTVHHEGRIGYHLRKGGHFFGLDDWRLLFAYRDRHHC